MHGRRNRGTVRIHALVSQPRRECSAAKSRSHARRAGTPGSESQFAGLRKSDDNFGQKLRECQDYQPQELFGLARSTSREIQPYRELRQATEALIRRSLPQCSRPLRRASFGLGASRLRFALNEPFSAEFCCNLLMRKGFPSPNFGSPMTDSLNHIEVIKHVLQTTVVWQSIKHGFHGFLCLHNRLLMPANIQCSCSYQIRLAKDLSLATTVSKTRQAAVTSPA